MDAILNDMGLFDRRTYIRAEHDSDEELMKNGTVVQCCVKSIKETRKGIVVEASPTEGPYVDRVWSKILPKGVKPKARIGESVNLYLDEVDCDGDFYLEV